MGEIKSTLDIVMEKTKHLSMTEEEKLARTKEEVTSAIKGLVQKYQDQVLTMEMLKKELSILHQRHTFEDTDVLLNEIFSRFDLESDNSSLLKLIKQILHIDPVKLEEALNRHKNELEELTDSKVEEIRNELKEKYSISGSAIVPNIESDPSWQTTLNDMKSRFHSTLNDVKLEIANQ